MEFKRELVFDNAIYCLHLKAGLDSRRIVRKKKKKLWKPICVFYCGLSIQTNSADFCRVKYSLIKHWVYSDKTFQHRCKICLWITQESQENTKLKAEEGAKAGPGCDLALTPGFLNMSCLSDKAPPRSLRGRKNCSEQERDKHKGECFVHKN